MQITILSTSVETVPTAKGSYQKMEVAYKDGSGQVKGKKIMSFGAQQATFNTLKDSAPGEIFSVESVKNDAGFWDWVKINRDTSTPGSTSTVAESVNRPAAGGKVVGSNYATAEERAKTQVYIVRQSSITAALSFLGGKSKSTDEVIQVAKEFEKHVMNIEQPSAIQALIDIDNDVPM